MHDQIKAAVDSTQRAQRNYDLSKTILEQDLETLIYAAVNSPSKQNETHYSLNVYTDQTIIRKIYDTTEKFTLGIQEALDDDKGEEWLYKNKSVKNSQIYANVLFVYVEDEGKARGATHLKAKHGDNYSKEILKEQQDYSIGISIGELILTAGLLGYRTGLCSAFNVTEVQGIINTNNKPKMLVGVGYDNAGTDRRLHAETLNRDVPEEARTGDLDEKWRFPSFEKHIKVFMNGTNT